MTEPPDIERLVDDWERDATEKATRYRQMQQQVEQISITESVADGAVRVTVGANGIPTGVAMTGAVRTMSPEQIAGAVMAAMRKAQSRYPEKIREILAGTVGDDATSRHLVEVAERNFPAPEESAEDEAALPGRQLRVEIEDDGERPAPPRRPPRSRENDDGEDFGDRSFLRRD
ncbi:YbaB/EbfC family nucleoid-associated protein [Amycolatopsis sp. NPDC024027]|uniref:YbaB/EbfC family nucleoid-associated protein n=1 Tax=Amycolatopsis sp. NPDC024027 TaxID=3154327 RepID=UPI0033F235F9